MTLSDQLARLPGIIPPAQDSRAFTASLIPTGFKVGIFRRIFVTSQTMGLSLARSVVSAVSNRVEGVFGVSSPVQVCHSIIGGVPVDMAPLRFVFGAGAYKGLQNQPVDEDLPNRTIGIAHPDSEVPSREHLGGQGPTPLADDGTFRAERVPREPVKSSEFFHSLTSLAWFRELTRGYFLRSSGVTA